MSPTTPTLKRHLASAELPDAVLNFEHLPPSARINSRSLKILLGIGDTTLWRRRKSGIIPEPDQHGTWSVSAVRELLGVPQKVAS